MLDRDFILQKATEVKTPFYLYRLNLLEQTLDACQKAAKKYSYHVHYALKANADAKVLQTISSHGFGADCVSGNEIFAAIQNGFDTSKVAFAGVGKSDEEINIGLDNDIFTFNVESLEEIKVINELAGLKGKTAQLALRINPNVHADTHKYITTGLEENKFGINRNDLPKLVEILKDLKSVKLTGLHFHIGSQITDLTPFKNLCNRVNEVQEWFISQHIHINHINVGGGLGIDYAHPDTKSIVDFEKFFAVFNEFLNLLPHQELHFELGRSITGQMGDLITKVLYIKEGNATNFAILDAGMTELIRPALYQAFHKIENLSTPISKENTTYYDVVGPICESSDSFGKRVALSPTKRGDIIAIRSAGAYGEVMASNYNLREKPEVVYYN